LSYCLPALILFDGAILFFCFFFLCIAAIGFLYLPICMVLLGMIILNFIYISVFFTTFNSLKKRDETKKLIDEKVKKKEEWFEKRKSIEPVCEGGLLQVWMKLALQYNCSDADNIKKLILQEGENLEQELLELNIQWEIYNQSPEKTFWQYLRSKKWLKKLTKDKEE